MHDLIREHARLLAGRLDPEGDREQVTGQLLDYYRPCCATTDRGTRPSPATPSRIRPPDSSATGTARQARSPAWPMCGWRPEITQATRGICRKPWASTRTPATGTAGHGARPPG